MTNQEFSPLTDEIAIIGMGLEFPGAHSPIEFWENVLSGRRFFRKTPPERMPSEYFNQDPNTPGTSYCDQMAVITDWAFDPSKFHLPPITVEASDLSHWLALDTSQKAIIDAGLELEKIDRSRIGVFIGNTLTGEFSRSHTLLSRWQYVERVFRRTLQHNQYPQSQIEQLIKIAQHFYQAPFPEITEDSLAGNMSNTIAGRICNAFDFGGGGYVIDGACSSSLLAVSHACEALLRNDLDFAVAGGVDISLDPFEIVGFAKAKALAIEDIRSYDANAAGMIPGEGCGNGCLGKSRRRESWWISYSCVYPWLGIRF